MVSRKVNGENKVPDPLEERFQAPEERVRGLESHIYPDDWTLVKYGELGHHAESITPRLRLRRTVGGTVKT